MKTSTQRGAALLTAMIIVTLVATLAAAMVWRQYRAVQVEAAERARAQAGWILLGALDYGRLILRSDKADVDHLNDPWAVPLEETRLSTFLAADKTSALEAANAGPEAFLYGGIVDAQSLYNLRNLTGGAQVKAEEQRTLERLCETAGVAPGVAAQLIARLREAFPLMPGSETAPLPPRTVEQLAWLGMDADTVQRLRPFTTLLPATSAPTPINLNTAPREVIAAVLEVDLAAAERLVQSRKATPLTDIEQARSLLSLPQGRTLDRTRADVKSSFFLVSGRLRLDDRVLEERSLVQRQGPNIILRQRERLAQQTPPRMPQLSQ